MAKNSQETPFLQLRKGHTDGRMDGRTNGPMDRASYRDALLTDVSNNSLPTNCQIVGPWSGVLSCPKRNEIRPGVKILLAGNSYQTITGRILFISVNPLCHPVGFPRIKAFPGAQVGDPWMAVAWAEPPLISTS